MAAPSTWALHTRAAAWTEVRCCRISPGFLRLARIFSISKGWPVSAERASDVRRTWPPPSPRDPSIFITARPLPSTLDADDLAQAVDDVHQVPLGLHHGVDRLVGGRGLVDHAGVLAALHARGRGHVVGHAEPPLRLRARHG